MQVPVTLLILLASQSTVADLTGPVTTPVFSQLVGYTKPVNFVSAFEDANATNYIHELVPQGETVEQWSQMITLSGEKGEAVDPSVTPVNVARHMASRFQSACPATFVTRGLTELKVNGHDAFVALLGCGKVRTGTPRSEIALVIAIRGRTDVYTIQWAERSAPIEQPPTLDTDMWMARYRQLLPVRVCERVPGEPAPYPSCINSPANQ